MICICGTPGLKLLPDEDAAELPPSFTAKLFHCDGCAGQIWLTAEELGLEDWPDDDIQQ